MDCSITCKLNKKQVLIDIFVQTTFAFVSLKSILQKYVQRAYSPILQKIQKKKKKEKIIAT